jgi:Lamin Tail Domain
MHRIRLLAVLAFAALLLAVPARPASLSGVVVSQVYAGGGNTGASFDHDFVELFNPGAGPADVNGWSIQYASAGSGTWQTTILAGQIPAGHYYLVQLSSAAAVGAALPVADATGTTNLAVSGGKVALVTDGVALSCGTAAGGCSTAATVEDFVGYGSAGDYEGSAAVGALSSSTAAVRADGGCTDTDSNHDDFSVAAPTPRNSSAAGTTCSEAPPPAGTSQAAGVDVDVQPVLSLSLERPTISFGSAFSGDTPAPISERVTVVSNNAAGYALAVHRTVFTPADLPLGLASTAPAGGTLGASLAGGARAAIPIAPAADLLIGTTSARAAAGGDAWPTTVGFTGPLPSVAPGHYSATVTYTLIGR